MQSALNLFLNSNYYDSINSVSAEKSFYGKMVDQ